MSADTLGFIATADYPDIDWARVADACERCIDSGSGPVQPYEVRRRPASITALYGCPRCGHFWFTSWAGDAVEMPVSTVRSIADVVERVLERLRGRGKAS